MRKLLLAILASITTLWVTNAVFGATYTVKQGDTLTKIARTYDTSVSKIVADNNILNPDLILVGEQLEVGGQDEVFGAASGYTPVTGYESRLTNYVTAAATTIPVASTKDISGQQISLSQISSSSTVYGYFTIEPNTSRQESVACSGVTATQWTNCIRGLPIQGGSMTASTTLAFAHNASSKIVMTNIGQFYNNFLSIDGGTQTVYGDKTFNSNDFQIGDNTTGTGKRVIFRVGKTNNPYLKFVGPSGSNSTSTLYYSIDGISDFQLNASGTTYGVQSGGGISLTNGLLSIKTSDPQTWTGAWTLNNQVTVGAGVGALYVPTPTDPANPTPMNYVNTQTWLGTATGTAGMAITAGLALYASPTSSLLLTNTSVNTSTFHFVGIAQESVASGATVKYSRPGATVCGLSGLTPGSNVYLNGTAGQISATPATKFARIGLALSSTCVQLMSPKYSLTNLRTVSSASNGSYFEATGFYPSKITIIAGPVSAGGSGGSVSLGYGLLGMSMLGTNNSVFLDAASTTPAYGCFDAGAGAAVVFNCGGTVTSRNESGFYMNVFNSSVDAVYSWMAESE